MNDFIAVCGLNCETCEARLATVNNDDALRAKVSEEWSKMNQVEITPEMINCEGCRKDGVKFAFCASLCPIRKCAAEKNYSTCGECSELECCEKLGMVTGNNAEARQNLRA